MRAALSTLLFVTLAIGLGASCGGNGALVVVTVQANGTLNVTGAAVSVTAAGKTKSFDVPLMGTLPPAQTFGVELPESAFGAVTISVTTKGQVATGMTTLTVDKAQTFNTTITLTGTVTGDMAVDLIAPDLTTASLDLAGADLAGMDLTVVGEPDLSVEAMDLAVAGQDLTVANSDLTVTAPDMTVGNSDLAGTQDLASRDLAHQDLTTTTQDFLVLPVLSAAPDVLHFGTIDNNTTKNLDITVTNNGGAAYSGPFSFGVTGTNADQYVTVSNQCLGGIAAGGGTCKLTLQFKPNTLGMKTATVNLSATGFAKNISVDGTSQAPGVPMLAISPSVFDFGASLINEPVTFSFLVSNNGSAPSGPLTLTDNAPFTIAATSTCTTATNLQPGNSCSLDITYVLNGTGTYSNIPFSIGSSSGATAQTTLFAQSQSSCQTGTLSAPQYVDPRFGKDLPSRGGNFGACAYKTLTYALSRAEKTVNLFAASYTAQSGETFPIVLTGTQTLQGNTSIERAVISGTGPYVSSSAMIIFQGTQNGLSNLDVAGVSAGYGIVINNPGQSPALPHYISAVNISNTGGSGVLVEQSNVVVTDSNFTGGQAAAIFLSGDDPINVVLTNNTFNISTSGWDIRCASTMPNVTGNSNLHVGPTNDCELCTHCPF